MDGKVPPSPHDPIDTLHPAVGAWFRSRFGAPTRAQALAWPAIARGENVLVLSPTGSGKTLAAFLVALSDVLRAGPSEARGIHTVYVSPLKALNADVHANLEEPLEGIRAADPSLPEITRALRTGDTPSGARQAMLRDPPDVLVTTPESLYLLVTSARSRELLRNVRFVVVDEVHSVLGSKRGVHLALTLERLAALSAKPFQRIGLSATVRPADEAAGFLGGFADGRRRPVTVVDAKEPKALDVAIEFPRDDEPEASAWPPIEGRVRDLVDEHSSTLVFANNRRLAERLANALTERNPARPLPAHHGSVSKETRKDLETRLRAGRLAGIVATSSLELGIDVGHVDLSVLIGSPRSVSRGLQRVGRAGHRVGETSVGRIFPTHVADLVESAVVARGMLRGDVEPTIAPTGALDVLAQQVVAHVAAEDRSVPVEEVARLVRGAWPYRDLPREHLVGVLEMLAGKYPAEAFRELRARLAWDRAADALRPLPGSRLLAIRNGGAIPDRGLYAVYLEDGRTRLGELDEEFVFESRVGDVFALGANAWRMVAIEQDRVLVTDAHGEMPKAPFWRGDQAPRPFPVSLAIGAFYREAERRLEEGPIAGWLRDEYRLDDAGAAALEDLLRSQREATGRLPTDRTILVEFFRDELGDPRLVLHAPFGGSVLGPLALGLKRVLEDRLDLEVQSFASDDGILFRFPDAEAPLPLDDVTNPDPDAVVEAVLRDVGDTALFAGLFRENAERALLLPRTSGSERRPFWIQRLRANDLLQVARRFADFPLLVETYRDALRSHLDVERLRAVLESIRSGETEVVVRHTDRPSPLATNLLFGFLGVYLYEPAPPRAERVTGYLAVRRELLQGVLAPREMRGLLRPEAIAAEARRLSGADHPPATADDVALLLARLGDMDEDEVAPLGPDAAASLRALGETGRAVLLHLPGFHRWSLVEEVPVYRAALGAPLTSRDAESRRALDELAAGRTAAGRELARLLAAGLVAEAAPGRLVALPREETPSSTGALRTLVARYARTRPPFTAAALASRYPATEGALAAVLDELVERGELVRGAFTPGRVGDEYAAREVIESVHRRTLAILRREAEPVEADAFARYLLRWHRVEPTHRRAGRAGLEAALDQLVGAPLPGEAWERDVLPARVDAYPAGALAELSTGGSVVWVGAEGGRFRPLRRGAASPYVTADPLPDDALSTPARAVRAFLRENGASFFHEIDLPEHAPPVVAQALAELVRKGEVTNDSFEVMRHVLRTGAGVVPRAPRLRARRGSWMGRWSLVKVRGVLGPPLPAEEAHERLARDLLRRHGVVSREAAAAGEVPVAWRVLASVLARLEARGEIRRGYFVRGLSGHQYALPEAVERLRDARKRPEEPVVTVLTAVDPANPYGTVLPFPSGVPFRKLARNYVVLVDGTPAVLAANQGRDLWPVGTLSPRDRDLALGALQRLLEVPAAVRTRRAVVVATWAGKPVVGSEAHRGLERAGFEAERGKLVLYPSHVRAA